jgi:Protein of unknown function (DUF3052)
MGLELTARAALKADGSAAQSGDAKVLVESDELIVRGAVRVKIPRRDIVDAKNKAGVVTVRYASGSLTLTLGDDAARFIKKLLEPPKSRLDKIGIAAGSRVVVIAVKDPDLAAELASRGVTVSARAGKEEAMILLGIGTAADLTKLKSVASSLAPAGALWVVHPKGTAGVKDTDIFAAAKAAGLTYTKVVKFSETHSAERLVIPKSARP